MLDHTKTQSLRGHHDVKSPVEARTRIRACSGGQPGVQVGEFGVGQTVLEEVVGHRQ